MVTDTARPPVTHPVTHRQDRIQYTAPQLASAQCNKATTCLYALKTLKAHGLQGQALRDVTPAMAQLLYASWSGFIKSEEKAKLQSVLNKTARYGFLPEWSPKTIDELLESSDITLFKAAL